MIELLLIIIYLCFISLGLPDSLLGSAWPTIYQELNVPISLAGFVSALISICTITSSLFSDKINHKFGTGKVTAFSIVLTALGLLGFSFASKFWMLLVFAIPFGLGAGGVDAALNNYVACKYKSHHMSWLHCMWGLGASISPYIMAFALSKYTWNKGYLFVAIIQMVISIIVFISLPLWKKQTIMETSNETKAKSFKEIFSIKGSIAIIIAFFCYCGLEQTSMLWASSYLVLHDNISLVVAASLATLFYTGMTIGRAINGFLTFKISDKNLIRLGSGIIFVGLIVMVLPLNEIGSYISICMIGLGCAPIYPCIIHSTPTIFGKENSQAMVGFQMAAAYTGCLTMPPLFGLLANKIGISILPIFLFILWIAMVVFHEVVERRKTNG